MAEPTTTKQSFSKGRRLAIGFNLCVSILALFALMVMVNYLASGYFKRFEWTANAQWKLAPQTLAILKSLTNDIEVTIFFDTRGPKTADVYDMSERLLKEYSLKSPHIKLKTIDYVRFPTTGELFLAKYKLGSLKDKDFVHFDNN